MLPEEEVKVKISICNECNGIVRTVVKHLLDRESEIDFALEVLEYNLKVKEQPLLEFRREKPQLVQMRVNMTKKHHKYQI